MFAFDTNILTEIMLGNAAMMIRAANIPVSQQAVPIIVVEEMIRGRLNIIRQAEAGKAKISLPFAYELFARTFSDLRRVQVLAYDDQADASFRHWRANQIRVATHDLRIAAICVAHQATLVTRNRRDFESIPNLSVEFWE